jgi:threonine dehydratase
MELLKTQDFETARQVAEKHIHRTPIIRSQALSDIVGTRSFLKAELLQRTGSYKIRGPLNVLHHMTEERRRKGVICSSAGNHAQGVAYAARAYGVPAVVVMGRHAPSVKIEATRAYGAEVILHGEIWDDAYQKSREIELERGLTYIHPFDDPRLMAGQGTVGLEIIQDLPEADYIIVPIGGGGLISGVAMAAKSINPRVKIIGVEAVGAPGMKRSVEAGHRVRLDEVTSRIDGLVVREVGENTFDVVRQLVDDIVLVSDEEIKDSIIWIMQRCKLVAEGAAAATVAALRLGRFKPPPNTTVVCVLSGGNLGLDVMNGLKPN